jgi:hypothetical protein
VKPPRKPRTRKTAAPKGTCGADPSSSLFPEQAPAGCVLVRAHYRRVKGKRKRSR